MPSILVISLVSGSTAMPRIDIEMEKPRVQLSHLEAMDLALNIIQCVVGAQADAFIYQWVLDRIPGTGQAEAVNLMRDFREFRDEINKRDRNA